MQDYTLPFNSVKEVLADKASTIPNQIAFRFLENGEDEGAIITYKQLYDQAVGIAGELIKITSPGDRAVLIYPTGIEFIRAFYACVLAGLVAVPMYPPSGRRRLGRLENVAKDCEPKVALTTKAIKISSEGWFDNIESMSKVKWLETDEIFPTVPVSLPEVKDLDLVFLQYTSGSTGSPKGVQVTHSNIIHNLHVTALATRWAKEVVGWLPIYHDMGLIGQILYTVYVGGTATLMSPVDFIKKPLRWLQALTKYKAQATPAPNFAYDLCLEQITDEELEHLDLSHLLFAMNGAEPVKANTLRRFTERFGSVGFNLNKFLPCYGMAETTLMVSGDYTFVEMLKLDKSSFLARKVKTSAEGAADTTTIELVSSGPLVPGYSIAIVDPETHVECAPDQIGEIWLKGPCVAHGYWERKELNSEVFGAFIKDEKGVYLRTGDMGFMWNNALYISGRLKEMMIINGANYYPQDIEATIQASDAALQSNAGAVFSVEDESGKEQLVAFQEITRTSATNFDPEALVDAINRSVTQTHEVSLSAIAFISPGRIPKTTSGKIQRTLCKKLYETNEIDGLLYKWNAKDNRKSVVATPSKPSGQTILTKDPKAASLQQTMKQLIATAIGVNTSDIDTNTSFASLGLSSIQGIQLAEKLSSEVGFEIPASALYDYFTINALTNHIVGVETEESLPAEKTGKAISEPIAIIGMACKFPGAENVEEFWSNLVNQVDSIQTVPADRWNYNDVYSETPAPDKMNTKWGGFMKNIDQFDAGFFSISPREAEQMDPQQRIVLEQTQVLFESAGYATESLKGKDIGVFLGISHSNYSDLMSQHTTERNIYSATGSALSIAANRVSYAFDFQGPSVAVDTACSSSLVALHQAMKSIRNGECSMAVAGGVNLILTPDVNMSFSQSGLTASDGHCKTFDAAADGIVRSEGCGVVLLKPLSKAVADGDRIIAVVHGSAINQDGRSNGLTAPNGIAQQRVIKSALADARIEASMVQYVETHGTGTILGDPIEVNALGNVYGNNRKSALLLGAVKANIGHLESAAGIAGIIKTALVLQNSTAPGQVHFKNPNPQITWDKIPVKVVAANTSLEGTDVYGAVSSFGFGGTNAHVILGMAPSAKSDDNIALKLPVRNTQLFCLSAKDDKVLKKRAADLARYLQGNQKATLSSIASTLALHKDHYAKRLVVGAQNKEQAIKALQDFTDGQENPWIFTTGLKLNTRKKAFLFTGAGAQYAGMGRHFYDTEPAFAEAIDACFRLARNYMEVDLKKAMFSESGSEDEKLLMRIDILQPAIFAYEYAMFKWWESLGVVPDMVIGHSLGEIVAACISGVMSLSEAMRLTILRGQLIYNMPVPGTMASIQATEEAVLEVIKGKESKVTIGVINGKNQTVVSGHVEEVEAVAAHFAAKGSKTKVLKIARAGHSPLMDAITAPFREVLESFKMEEARIPLVSNVTGKVAGPEISTPQYWVDHLRKTVRFSDGLNTLRENGCDILIEMGPNPTLLGIASFEMPDATSLLFMASATEDDILMNTAHSSVAKYHAEGGDINWNQYFYRRRDQFISLPVYPFQRNSYWIEKKTSEASHSGIPVKAALLQRSIEVASLRALFEMSVSGHAQLNQISYMLGDVRCIHTGALLEITAEAMQALNSVRSVERMDLHSPCIIGNDEGVVIQFSLDEEGDTFKIFAGTQAASQWEKVASGKFSGPVSSAAAADNPAVQKLKNEKFKKDSGSIIGSLTAKGIDAKHLNTVTAIYSNETEFLLELNESNVLAETPFAIIPGIVEMALLSINNTEPDESLLWPSHVQNFQLFQPSAAVSAVLVQSSGVASNGNHIVSIQFIGSDGVLIASMHADLKISTTAELTAGSDRLRTEWIFETSWQSFAPASKPLTVSKWMVVNASGKGAGTKSLSTALKSQSQAVELRESWASAQKDLSSGEWEGIIVYFEHNNPSSIPAEVSLLAKVGLEVFKGITALIADGKLNKLRSLNVITEGFTASSPSLPASAVWGIGRTFFQEYPHIPLRLIDLANYTAATNKLAEAILFGAKENQVSVSGNDMLALRLQRYTAAASAAKKDLTTASTYLVTGGLGDLGLKAAKWISENLHIAHLILTGRSEPGSEAKAVIDGLRKSGIIITVEQGDIANAGWLKEMIGRIPKEYPLKGIIHAAGAKDDALIKDQSMEKFEKVMQAKVKGTWNLHELTSSHNLEVFSMFSSLTALAGVPGVANYAVGNLFLDAMAQFRAAAGLQATSINWGAWTNAGMLKDRSLSDIRQEMRARGAGLIDEHLGFDLFGYTLRQKSLPAQVVIAPMYFDNTAPFETATGTIKPIYSLLFESQTEVAEEALVDLRKQLRVAPADERQAILAEAIRKQVAIVTRQDGPESIDPDGDLFSLGVDSLMSAELVNRLSKLLKQELSPTIIFDQRTVNTLSEFLLEVSLNLDDDNPEADDEPSVVATPEARQAPVEMISVSANVKAPAKELSWKELLANEIASKLIEKGKDGNAVQSNRDLRKQLEKLAEILEKKT
jgi:acyl transferase domain-containing protein/acyl-CoA synthetase (AMP-forming)/AMP-acid ligase II/acyl carrier protein